MANTLPVRYRIAAWVEQNQARFSRAFGIGTGVVFVASVMLWVGVWFTLQQQADALLAAARQVVRISLEAQSLQGAFPQKLLVSQPVSAQSAGEDSVYVIEVDNPNAGWVANRVAYTADGQTVETVIMPKSTAAILMSSASGAPAGSVRVEWARDSKVYQQLPVTKDVGFSQRVSSKNTSTLNVYRVTGNLANPTSVSFWEVPLVVVLRSSDGRTVGAQLISVPNVAAGSEVPFDATWSGAAPEVSSVQVFVQVNPADGRFVKKQVSGPGELR